MQNSELAHPADEPPEVEGSSAGAPVTVETFDGRFDAWIADCPLEFTSPNSPKQRDILETVLLSHLAGHNRYAHITALRGDGVNPVLLGMSKIMSEDSVRRAFERFEETAATTWMQMHLDHCPFPILQEPWVLDVDTTVKPLYGKQDGAEVGYNPQ